MARPPELKVRDVVVMVLASCLVAATAVFGWITYTTLYGLILAGFEARLTAVATITGSFIDGSRQADLLLPRHVVGLTAVPGQPYLLGLDTLRKEVVAVDRVQGGARRLAPVDTDSLRGLMVDGDRFVTHHVRAGWLVVDTVTGALRPVQHDPPGVPPIPRGVPDPFRGMSRNPSSGEILILAGDPPWLFRWDHDGATAVGAVHSGAADEPTPRVDGLAFAADGILYAAGERLVELGADDAVRSAGTFVAGFRSEGQPDYQRYVRPMRRIARSEDLAYLYTQVVDPAGRIRYILDATEGIDHSFIGDPDSLPAAEIEPTLRVQQEGGVYITGLKRWEDWGFLKSAYAPVLGDDGRPVAMAGADVAIGSISRRTRSALARVILLGVAVLVLGGMVSFWISERLTQPLSSLKDAALRLAAGQLGTRVPVSGPTEIRRLATEFNHMSQVLDVRIQSLREQGRSLERERLLRELDREFGDESAQRTCPTLFLTRGAGTVDASGAAPTRGGGAVVWLSRETEHPEEALRLRATLHRLAQRLSAEAWLGLDLPGAMGKQGIHTVAVVSPDGAVTLRSARSGSVSLQGAGASRSPASVDAIRLGSGCRLALSACSPAGATTFRAVLDPSGNGDGTP